MTTENQNQGGGDNNRQIAKYENIADQVLNRIEKFQADGGITIPANYSVENNMKSAWLVLQATEDRNGNKALSVCTKESIANALFDMVLQGLSVSKRQGYFIVYGNKLEFQRSYFGTVALAKRTGGMTKEPVANVIYEGDDFAYSIDPETARIRIVKHEQRIENIDNNKIKAAYALVTMPDGETQVTIMSMQQIRAAWNQGATKGNSPAHKNFAEEMAKKTVIGRACKMIINSSDDAWLYEGKGDDMDTDVAGKQREAAVNTAKQTLNVSEDADYEEVGSQPQTVNENEETAAQAPAQETEEEDPGY